MGELNYLKTIGEELRKTTKYTNEMGMTDYISSVIEKRVQSESTIYWAVFGINKAISEMSSLTISGVLGGMFESHHVEMLQNAINMLLNLLNGIHQDLVTNTVKNNTKINIYYLNNDVLHFEII